MVLTVARICGACRFSAAYPILWHQGVAKDDSYDAVSLLLSWLWDGPWEELSKKRLVEALEAADARDAQAVCDLEPYYFAEDTKRRRTAPPHNAM